MNFESLVGHINQVQDVLQAQAALTKGLTLCEQGTEVFDLCLRGIWKTEVRAASVFLRAQKEPSQ